MFSLSGLFGWWTVATVSDMLCFSNYSNYLHVVVRQFYAAVEIKPEIGHVL